MKNLFFLIGIFFSINISAQLTYVPDVNFEIALANLGYDNGVLDHYVPTANINSIPYLYIPSKGISDLTGIEDFISLTLLNCASNNLSSINISNNTALTTFSCAGNNLTSLDVSNNTLLTLLTISNNQITSIDLSTNNLLERIYFSNNLIETIDLNSKPFLTEVSLENNALSSFNIKNGNNTLITDINLLNNSDLYCVEVDNITYSNANWLNKDAQTKFRNSCVQTYIPDGNFEQELINLGYDTILDSYVYTEDIEQITNLNVSSKGIIDLTGIADFINLRHLDVSNNILATLNLSQNTFLITLNCSNNQITTLNLGSMPGLVLLDCNTNLLSTLNLNSLIGLRNLNCSNNNLTNLNISNNIFLKYLYCGSNQLANLDVSDNLSLIYLSCVNNQITSLDISNNILLADLRCRNNLLTTLNTATNINLTDLVCQYNLITDLDLSNNTALTRLLCQNNKLIDLNIKNGNNSSIANLDFNASNNPNLFCIQVDSYTYSNSNWSQKDGHSTFRNSCAKTYVPDDNFEQALIDAGFDTNPVLDDYIYTEVANITTGLIFNSKNISDLTGLENFISLTYLNLNNNNLTNIDLSFCPNLQYVYLNNNAFTNLDLSANPLLLQLTCNGNQLTELNLNINNLIYILHCSNNQIIDLDLSTNTQLVELFCNTNQLTSLNFKNGYNSHTANINFNATSNPNLFCIEVDNAVYSTANWSNIDAQSSFSTNCHYFETYVPDNNFEQELINLGYDTILDNYVTTANINTITSLNLNAKNISDLTGIEDFTALQTLYCVNNLLTDLDISNNTNLVNLYCQNNNLTTLDTNNNTTLEILNCASNQITSLDLSQNTSLIDINCSNNLLTNLNVFHNIALTNLDCSINQISGLNLVTNTNLSALNCSHNLLVGLILTNGNNTAVSNTNYDSTYNASLTCIEVDNVTYSSANWTNIDFHASFSTNCHYGETYVPDDNFEQELINLGYDTVLDDYVITANINTVGLLDVSFKSITDLTGIDGFTALTQLLCNNNNIGTLDLSKNVMLNYLNCSFNFINDIYITSPNLIYISASHNQLLDMDLSNKLFLTYVELNNNSLNSLNIKNGNNTSITNFNIVNNPNLLCVQVDDITYSTINWINKDTYTNYNVNCNYPSIWRTAHWINGTPNLGKNAVIDDIYNTGAFGNINTFQLTVEPTKTVTVSPNSFIRVNSNVINNGELIIEHKGSFVQLLNSAIVGGTGIYTVKNKTTLLADADRFTYFSSPVANENLNTFSSWANTNALFSFDAFAQSWLPEISSAIMQQSKGYIAKGKPDVGQYPFRGETNFKGNFNNGIFSVPLHYTASSPSMDDDNTLVGNPYPSAISATLLLNNNPQANAFYFWTHKSGILPNGTAYAGDDYAIWNYSGGIASASGSPAPSGFIASCQGFFVDANASGTLTFDNSIRVTGNNNDFRIPNTENRERIWINLEHEYYGVFNQILLNFNENGTTNFDAKLDAVRFYTGNAISFYSNGVNQEHFAIQALPLLTEDTVVPLGFEVNNSTINHLKIAIDHTEIDTNTTVYLKDNQENILHSLSDSEYNFTTTQGNYPNRFELVFRRDALSNPQEITNTESLIVSNYSKNEIKINTKNGANYTQIKMFDILGKEIIYKNQLYTNSIILNINIKQRTVLFIKVQLENGKILMKKFLKI